MLFYLFDSKRAKMQKSMDVDVAMYRCILHRERVIQGFTISICRSENNHIVSICVTVRKNLLRQIIPVTRNSTYSGHV